METVGIEPTSCSVQATGAPRAHPRGEVEPPRSAHSTSVDPGRDQSSDATYGAHLRFDHGVSCCQGGGHSVTAVTYDERIALSCESHRWCVATLLEPYAVELDRRHTETGDRALADADLVERCPDRLLLVRAHGPSSLHGRRYEVRTGGVEPPQPEATRLQRAELSRAQRPHEVARVGFEPTVSSS